MIVSNTAQKPVLSQKCGSEKRPHAPSTTGVHLEERSIIFPFFSVNFHCTAPLKEVSCKKCASASQFNFTRGTFSQTSLQVFFKSPPPAPQIVELRSLIIPRYNCNIFTSFTRNSSRLWHAFELRNCGGALTAGSFCIEMHPEAHPNWQPSHLALIWRPHHGRVKSQRRCLESKAQVSNGAKRQRRRRGFPRQRAGAPNEAIKQP